MFRALTFTLFATITIQSFGQFYPPISTDAAWCMHWNDPTFGPRSYRFALYNGVDTIISDTTYQIMYDRSPNNTPYWQERYFVRSGDDGKGYLRYTGSSSEYLTGDLGAAVGDTVRNVLVMDRTELPLCGEPNSWKLIDFVVDSIVTDTNQIGYQRTRHYVTSPCRNVLGTNELYYWEQEIGNAFGPCITWSDIPVYWPCYIVVDDTLVGGVCVPDFNVEGDPANGVCDLTVGLFSTSTVSSFQVRPNPTHGRITVGFSQPLQRDTYCSVLDATGRLLYQRPLPAGGTEEDIDLSRFGRGTYILRITDPEGQRNERVVVE
jgi:hypothetical protein